MSDLDQDSDDSEVGIDGAEEDEILSRSKVLSVEEVIRRRARRTKQLIKLYRMQYWSLMEEMRAKYRKYYLRTGKSGWRDENEEADRELVEGDTEPAGPGTSEYVQKKGTEGGMREPHAPERAPNESLKCGFQGCKGKPLPLSIYCFSHILLEPRQCLYRACTYSIESGKVTCGRPVLRSMTPSYCTIHIQQGRKSAVQDMKTPAKGRPKTHILLAEYVRLIQNRRRKRKRIE